MNELKVKKDVGGLINTLKTKKAWYVRRNAVWALGESGDFRAVEPLMEALEDTDERVRRNAADALAKIKSSDAYRRAQQADKVNKAAKRKAEEAKKAANERKIEYDSAVKSISEAEEILSEPRAEGVVVTDELLTKSKQAFDDGDYVAAIRLAEELKNFVEIRETSYRESREGIKSAKSTIERATKLGCDISSASSLLEEANSTFDAGNYEKAIECAKQSEDTTKKIQEDSRPEITLNFPEETFPPNKWKKINVTIQNTGSMHAKEIEITHHQRRSG